jgi:hypothetical protein
MDRSPFPGGASLIAAPGGSMSDGARRIEKAAGSAAHQGQTSVSSSQL